MGLYTNYTAGQDFIIRDNSLLITPDQPTPFLQTNPYSTSTATNCSLEVGKSFSSLSYRSIFYGGNLGVSQGTTTFGNYGCKWSMTGAYRRGCTPASGSTVNGLNFLVNQHLWGNYSTFFGLRADSTADVGVTNVIGKRRSAVISWSYERNNTPNRLIFQTIQGINDAANGMDNVEYEWATILSNGNIGSGTSTPAAQLEVKHITEPLCMQIFDENNNSVFRSYKEGRFGIGNSASPSTVPFAVLDVTGRIDVLGSEIISSPSGASGPFKIFHLKDNSGTPIDLFYMQNDGNAFLDGSVVIRGRTSAFPLTVTDNSNNPIFRVRNTGDVGLVNLAGLAGSGNVLSLYIDNDGIIVPGGTSYTPWETGGNNTGSSSLTFGTNDPADIDLVAGGVSIGTIEGTTGGDEGFLSYLKPASFGTAAAPTSNYTLSSHAITSGAGKGPLNCFDNSGTSQFRVENTSINFLNSTLIMNESAGSAYLNGNVIIDGATTLDIVHPFDGTNSHIGFNSTGDYFGNCYADDWLQGSDRRIKNDIDDLKYGLNEVLKLKPKTYKLKSDNSSRIGFIAQDVVDIIPEMVTIPQNDSQIYALSYMSMIPVLTKAIQEQQEIINLQQEKLNLLNEKLEILFSNTLVKDNKDNLPKQKEMLNQLPVLFQNHPNPFNGFTYVDYFLPPNASNAFLRVVDINGKLIKSFPINNLGYGQIQLDCTNLATGTYYYSLLVNGKSVDTKTMLIAIDN